jgi:hypothetical protein
MKGGDEVWGGRFEFYLTDPAEQPDREKWSIEIAYLLRDDPAEGERGARSGSEPESDLPSGLAKPARRALAGAGYVRLEQLSTVSEAEVLRLHGMGPKALDQLRRALAARGLSFADVDGPLEGKEE